MLNYIVIPTKSGTVDAFSFNKTCRNSRFMLSDSPCSPVPLSDVKKNYNAKLVSAVFSYCFLYCRGDFESFSIDLNRFGEYSGFTYGSHGVNIYTELLHISKISGVIDDECLGELVKDVVMSEKSVNFSSKYFAELIKYMREGCAGERHSYFSSVLLTSAFRERNRAGFEVACVLCSMSERRGTVYGGRSDIRLDTLINRCPYFEYRFCNAENAKKNYVLKSTLLSAVEILKADSILEKKYGSVTVDLPSVINRFELGEYVTVTIKRR